MTPYNVANSVDVMLDLETVGIHPGCAILSIGACTLDQEHVFYQTVSLRSGLDRGLKQEHDTMSWWDRQSPEARLEAFSGTTSVMNACGEFYDWFRRLPAKKKFIWSNGSDFDIPILAEVYAACDMYKPWDPFNGRCYRTIKKLYKQVVMPETGGVKHNALDDAVNQARHLVQILHEHHRRSYK